MPSKIIYLSPIVSGKALIKVVLQQQSSFTFVNHQLLEKKLSGYGIKNHELRWFENSSWVSTVSICCSNGSAQSASQQIKSGIPQGPIPCLILFFIHISDLIAQVSTSCSHRSFYTDSNIRKISIIFNPFAPGDFAEKRVLRLVEWFSGLCRAIKS